MRGVFGVVIISIVPRSNPTSLPRFSKTDCRDWSDSLVLKIVSYTAKNVIGNRLFRLKSASLLMQNTINSIGIFLTTHSMLLYIVNIKKCFPTVLMGEYPWYLMENSTPRLCWELPTIYRKILMPG